MEGPVFIGAMETDILVNFPLCFPFWSIFIVIQGTQEKEEKQLTSIAGELDTLYINMNQIKSPNVCF